MTVTGAAIRVIGSGDSPAPGSTAAISRDAFPVKALCRVASPHSIQRTALRQPGDGGARLFRALPVRRRL